MPLGFIQRATLLGFLRAGVGGVERLLAPGHPGLELLEVIFGVRVVGHRHRRLVGGVLDVLVVAEPPPVVGRLAELVFDARLDQLALQQAVQGLLDDRGVETRLVDQHRDGRAGGVREVPQGHVRHELGRGEVLLPQPLGGVLEVVGVITGYHDLVPY